MSKVRIIYKSGAQIDVSCDSFETEANALGVLTKIKWENATPRPMFLGINDISAVWQLD